MSASQTLIQQVKDKLQVTWSDTDTDRYITDITNSAIDTIKNKLGIKETNFDFSVAGQENTVFLSYCLYIFNQEECNFDDNYRNDILQLRQKHLLNQYKQEQDDDSE